MHVKMHRCSHGVRRIAHNGFTLASSGLMLLCHQTASRRRLPRSRGHSASATRSVVLPLLLAPLTSNEADVESGQESGVKYKRHGSKLLLWYLLFLACSFFASPDPYVDLTQRRCDAFVAWLAHAGGMGSMASSRRKECRGTNGSESSRRAGEWRVHFRACQRYQTNQGTAPMPRRRLSLFLFTPLVIARSFVAANGGRDARHELSGSRRAVNTEQVAMACAKALRRDVSYARTRTWR